LQLVHAIINHTCFVHRPPRNDGHRPRVVNPFARVLELAPRPVRALTSLTSAAGVHDRHTRIGTKAVENAAAENRYIRTSRRGPKSRDWLTTHAGSCPTVPPTEFCGVPSPPFLPQCVTPKNCTGGAAFATPPCFRNMCFVIDRLFFMYTMREYLGIEERESAPRVCLSFLLYLFFVGRLIVLRMFVLCQLYRFLLPLLPSPSQKSPRPPSR